MAMVSSQGQLMLVCISISGECLVMSKGLRDNLTPLVQMEEKLFSTRQEEALKEGEWTVVHLVCPIRLVRLALEHLEETDSRFLVKIV